MEVEEAALCFLPPGVQGGVACHERELKADVCHDP